MSRSMSERKRAFDALQGVEYPRIGDEGRWRDPSDETRTARVRVVHISVSGGTLWTKFVRSPDWVLYGAGPHRWERSVVPMIYYCGGAPKGSTSRLYGMVTFPS